MRTSVIICTYNRSTLLGDAIKSIQNQDIPHSLFEIVVVDNNSTDNTKGLVTTIAHTSSIVIKYILEKNQGLSYARNAGIKHARGEIIAFTDDDIEAEKTWLSALISAFDSPDVYCAGGPIRPLWPGEIPSWLTEFWQRYLTINEFPEARKTGEFQSPHDYPWGANIAFHKKVFDEIGSFPTNLGRKGQVLLSNEELELCRKIESRGKRIRFAPQAVIYHKIPPERIEKLWFYHRTYYQGRSEAVLSLNTQAPLYQQLRSEARELVLNQIDSGKSDFDRTCFYRAHSGFLHQLLIYSEDEKEYNSIHKLRIYETFMSEIIKTFLQHLDGANKEEEIGILKERIKHLEGLLDEVRNSFAYKIYSRTLKPLKKMLKKLVHNIGSMS